MSDDYAWFLTGDRAKEKPFRPIEPRLIVPFERGELLTLLVPFVGLVFCLGYYVGFGR